MHATHTGRPSRPPHLAAYWAALTLASGAAPLIAQDALPAPVTPAPQAEFPAPAPMPQSGDSGLNYNLDLRPPGSLMDQPELAGPESASFEVSRAVPFVSKLTDLNLFSGLYEFEGDANGNLAGVHPATDLAHTNRIDLEDAFSQRPDLNRRNSFVGLWASVPLRNLAPHRSQTPATAKPSGDGPTRTLIASIGGEPTRHRTSRRPDLDGAHSGFFSRLRPAERAKPAPTPALPSPPLIPAPVEVEPTIEPTAPASPAPAPKVVEEKAPEKPASRGMAINFISRIRK